ncbi:hypothetical protein FGG08_004782 [Glutinoglossum americanum]|uniref:Haloacid dehalogenase n=1 Tax=Glutinoglossum americanum TaxID=1670608 RepID=A0A9P8IAQ2_9PEZI|nr:hypothetical protein FGG08_004782 [Glutinoglossum americanum]
MSTSSPAKPKDLTTFTTLSFDIYGTLIDWSSGLLQHLSPLLTRTPSPTTPTTVLTSFHALESQLQRANPTLTYSTLLAQTYLLLARQLSADTNISTPALEAEAKAFGNSIGAWPAFPDTVSALESLGKRYTLIALSNVDRDSLQNSISGPLAPAPFAATYTAQDIGSYKPALRNFDYLLEHAREEFGCGKGELLHVAQSLWHDHVPAREVGLRSVWIAREGGGNRALGREEEGEGKVGYEWRFETLGEFAEEIERAFAEKET